MHELLGLNHCDWNDTATASKTLSSSALQQRTGTKATAHEGRVKETLKAAPAADVIESEGIRDVTVVEPVARGGQQNRPVAGVIALRCAWHRRWRRRRARCGGGQQVKRGQNATMTPHGCATDCGSQLVSE